MRANARPQAAWGGKRLQPYARGFTLGRMIATSASPTRVRYGVLGFACSLSMITYLDRASFGVASDPIIKALGFQSIADITLAIAAFNLAYAAFEVPTGWLGDVYGPRKTLIRIVLWWSLFIALTGMAGMQVGSGVVLIN